jgi:flagellar protein FliO/FliZ
MFEALFGAELPLAVRFLVAFLIVLVLIGATFWAIRRIGGAPLGSGMIRGRQPRLAVIETAAVYGRRYLVLVRRDNVEHLLMIGGPADVVIEQNIMRAVPVTREVMAPRAPGVAEAMAKAPVIGTPPLHSDDQEREIAARSGPLSRPEPPVRPGLPARPETRAEPIPRQGGLIEPRGHQPAEQLPRRSSDGALQGPLRPTQLFPPGPRPPAEPSSVTSSRPAPVTTEAELNDMALRLEAALRRPIPPALERGEPAPKPAAVPESPPPSPEPAVAIPLAVHEPESTEPAPAPIANTSEHDAKQEEPARAADADQELRPEPRPPSSRSVFVDNLEQEMANLLGRPVDKE